MSSLFAKIRELGDARSTEELSKLIKEQDADKLSKLMKSKLVDPLAPRVLNFIFESLTNSGPDQMKRIKIMENILLEAPKQHLTNLQNNALVMRLAIEVDQLPTAHMVTLTDYCITQLQKEKPDSSSWKELLPKLLYLVKDKQSVLHCGNEITGAEYKSQVIHALCMAEWKSDNITMIADMFSEVPLSEEEMKQVMGKLYEGLAELEPSQVPPLVYQLLRVCGDRCCLLLLMHVQQYFTSRINPLAKDGADTDMNISISTDAIGHGTVQETKQSEGTVLFHILHFASMGEPTIKHLLRTLRSLSQAPEIIFGGSLLLPSALLMVASLSPYKDQVLGLLSTAIHQAIQDDEHRTQSSWVHELVPSQRRVQSALENIIDETPVERGMVLEGLVKLCFELLQVKRRLKAERCAEQMWSLGSSVLMYLIKKNRDAVSTVVEQLVQKIMPSKNTTTLIRVFQQLVHVLPRQLLHSREFLSLYMVDQLMCLSGCVAEQVILALVPLLQISESLCNSLVIVLRKALNVPRTEIRQMAVTGFLLMMQRLKVKRLGSGLSQNYNSCSSTTSSQMTDITVHNGSSTPVKNPEAMCLELLQILRHCFTYQAEVKLRLYQGMYELAICNPEMTLPALQFLAGHLSKFRTLDPASKCPFVLEMTSKESLEEDEMVLKEPLGHLLFAVTQVLCRVKDSEEKKPWFHAVEKEMATITSKMSQCELHDFGFEEEETTIEEGVKGSRKLVDLSLVMGIYEAVISFSFHLWSRDKQLGAVLSKKITELFKGYSAVSNYTKALKRPNKKKAADDSQAGAAGAATAPANPRKRGRPGAGATANHARGSREVGGVKLPPVVDLNTMQLILNLLYNDEVEWADEIHAGHVRSKRELQVWALNSLLNLLLHCKTVSLNTLMDKHSLVFSQLCAVGQVLYQKCICRLQEMVDICPDTASLALETFCELMAYMNSDHRALFPAFLIAVCGTGDEADSATVVGQIAGRLQMLLAAVLEQVGEEGDETIDASTKKLPKMLVAALTQICSLLATTDPQLKTVLDFLQDLCRNRVVPDDAVVRGLLELLVSLYARKAGAAHPMLLIARHLCHLTGTIDDEELTSKHRPLAVISESQVTVTTQVLCGRLKETLEHLGLVINRLKYERKMLPYIVNQSRDDIEANTKCKERSLCSYIVNVMEVAMLLTSMCAPSEHSEVILRLISTLYVTLTNLCKHFSLFSTRVHAAFRGANFERVVRFAGKQLAANISSFITYIEGKQREKYEQLQGGKRFNPTLAQKRVQRESDCIARTVLEMERFSKTVIQLSTKTKIPLNEHLHLGVSHDFRINTKELQKQLATMEEEDSGSESTGGTSREEETEARDEEENMEEDD